MRTRVLWAIFSGLALAVLPLFLVAGLAPQIRHDLSLSETQLGLVITTALVVSAATAVPAGRLADRVGARSAIVLGSALSVASLLGIGTLAETFAGLAVCLALSGLAIAVADTGFARLIASVFPSSGRGFAFGVKEAAIPAATLAVGLAIPILTLTFGWRSTVYVGLVPLIVLVLTLPRSPGAPRSPADPDRGEFERPAQISRPALAAMAAALGTAAASGVKVFLTETAVREGVSAGAAGILLVVAGLAGIITRIAMGRRVDRRTGKAVPMTSALMLIGCAAMVLGATGWAPMLIPAAIGAFVGAAGWSGLFLYALVESRPGAAGAAAGVGIAGLTVGGAIGPVAFGLAIEHASMTAAWLGAAVLIGLASVIIRVAGRQAVPAPAQTRTV